MNSKTGTVVNSSEYHRHNVGLTVHCKDGDLFAADLAWAQVYKPFYNRKTGWSRYWYKRSKRHVAFFIRRWGGECNYGEGVLFKTNWPPELQVIPSLSVLPKSMLVGNTPKDGTYLQNNFMLARKAWARKKPAYIDLFLAGLGLKR